MRWMVTLWVVMGLGAVVEAADPWQPAIQYVESEEAIWVHNYREQAPARPADLVRADASGGWGRVHRVGTTDVVKVDANLWIGDEEGIGCFFQIGSPESPGETLVVRGTVWVRPPRESPKRPDGRAAIVNRLTLGVKSDPRVQASLLIDCEKPREHGVLVGERSKDRWVQRGSLHVYHSTISALRQDKAHAIGAPKLNGWFATDVRLIDAELSWFAWTQTYGLNSKNAVIRGTTFAHGGTAFYGSVGRAEGCTFRGLEQAIFMRSTPLTLYNCTFSNNVQNIRYHQNGGDVDLIDCRLGDPAEPLRIPKVTWTPQRAARYGMSMYPSVTEWQTLQVEVKDGQANPVPYAFVSLSCDEHPEAVRNPATVTGADGVTAGGSWDKRIAFVTRRRQATDNPDRVREIHYEYSLSVRAQGFEPWSRRIEQPAEFAKAFTVRLRKADVIRQRPGVAE